jgi:hypothetical protein
MYHVTFRMTIHGTDGPHSLVRTHNLPFVPQAGMGFANVFSEDDRCVAERVFYYITLGVFGVQIRDDGSSHSLPGVFDEDRARYFFGRECQVDDCVDIDAWLAQQRK